MSNIRMLGNKIAIRPDRANLVSDGGIILTKEDPLMRGEVVSVGPGYYLDNGDFVSAVVEVGSIVGYSSGGELITVNGEQLIVITESQVIGVLS